MSSCNSARVRGHCCYSSQQIACQYSLVIFLRFFWSLKNKIASGELDFQYSSPGLRTSIDRLLQVGLISLGHFVSCLDYGYTNVSPSNGTPTPRKKVKYLISPRLKLFQILPINTPNHGQITVGAWISGYYLRTNSPYPKSMRHIYPLASQL